MALIECSECRNQVSDKAKTCPSCGAGVKISIAAHKRKARKEKWAAKSSLRKTFEVIAALVLVMFVFKMFSVAGNDNAHNTSNASTTVAQPDHPADLRKAKDEVANALKDPQKVKMMECIGVKVYEDPQPAGHPPSAEECARIKQQANAGALTAADAPTIAPESKPSDDQSGPYDNSEQNIAWARYKQSRDAYLAEARDLYFAVGCKVFGNEADIMPLLNSRAAALQYEAQSGPKMILDTDLNDLFFAAASDGMARSAKTGECDYWKNNPQAVYEVRRLARAMQ